MNKRTEKRKARSSGSIGKDVRVNSVIVLQVPMAGAARWAGPPFRNKTRRVGLEGALVNICWKCIVEGACYWEMTHGL